MWGPRSWRTDGEPFDQKKMKRLTAALAGQFAESDRLEQAIRHNLKWLGFELEARK